LKVDYGRIVGLTVTTLQLAKLQECTNSMHHKITAWMKIQELYRPVVAKQCSLDNQLANTNADEVPIYSIPLYLPSQLLARTRNQCPQKFLEYESKL
jgi:hypothetical protein